MSKSSSTRSQNDPTQGKLTNQVDLEQQGGTDNQTESPSPQGESTRTCSPLKSTDVDDSVTPVTKEITTEGRFAQGIKRFKELDCLIVSGLSQSLVAARALREMEQGKYYIFGGYKTIAEYGSKVMKLAESTIHQYVNAGRVAKRIDDSTVCRLKPFNEAQLRPLLNVHDNEKLIEIWKVATLNGEIGLTEKSVASAKRQVLKQELAKPKDISVEDVTRNLHKAIRRGWDACQGQQVKLLDKLLVVLKGLFDELNQDERSPRVTAIFTSVEVDVTEPQATATAVLDSTQSTPRTADVSNPASDAAASLMTPHNSPAKIAKPQTGRQSKLNTVRDHLSKLRDGFDQIAAELRKCQKNWPKNLHSSQSYQARGNAIPRLETATRQLAQIADSVGGIANTPFSTKIVPRGSRSNRLLRMTEVLTAVVEVIQVPAPKAAQELQQVVADLDQIHSCGGL